MTTIPQIQMFVIGLSVLVIALELPLAMNLVKPNRVYGFRIRKTLSDERIWYRANSYAGKGSVLVGIITVVLAVALRFMPMSPVAYGAICLLVLVGGLMLTIAMTLAYVKRVSQRW